MSKNYTNYSKPNEGKKQDEVVQVPVETAIGVVDPDQAQVPVMAVAPKVDEQTSTSNPVPDSEPIIGVVSNCKMLNVRAEPDKKAPIHAITCAGDEVEIIEEGSTEDFYRIHYVTSKDVDIFGYCMKDFITIK